MHHSDRGSQYAAGAYQKQLTKHGIVCSMSRKGNCWDNAPMESFFHTLKTELVHHRDYLTRDEARRDTQASPHFLFRFTWRVLRQEGFTCVYRLRSRKTAGI